MATYNTYPEHTPIQVVEGRKTDVFFLNYAHNTLAQVSAAMRPKDEMSESQNSAITLAFNPNIDRETLDKTVIALQALQIKLLQVPKRKSNKKKIKKCQKFFECIKKEFNNMRKGKPEPLEEEPVMSMDDIAHAYCYIGNSLREIFEHATTDEMTEIAMNLRTVFEEGIESYAQETTTYRTMLAELESAA